MGYTPVEREEARGRREKRAATARPERIWDYAVIPYEIDSNFSGVHKVKVSGVTISILSKKCCEGIVQASNATLGELHLYTVCGENYRTSKLDR